MPWITARLYQGSAVRSCSLQRRNFQSPKSWLPDDRLVQIVLRALEIHYYGLPTNDYCLGWKPRERIELLGILRLSVRRDYDMRTCRPYRVSSSWKRTPMTLGTVRGTHGTHDMICADRLYIGCRDDIAGDD